MLQPRMNETGDDNISVTHILLFDLFKLESEHVAGGSEGPVQAVGGAGRPPGGRGPSTARRPRGQGCSPCVY